MPVATDILALRSELDHARWKVADWRQRGAPPIEGPVLLAELAAAEAAVANAIGSPSKKGSAVPIASTAKASQDMINHETDARFWAQTHYKVGQRLDPSNPTDKSMMRVWIDINAKVRAEDAAGRLKLTYNHPQVAQNLSDAAVANQAAVASLDAAASAPDAQSAAQHAAAANAAQQIGQQAAANAAALQPASVSPDVVAAASADAHAAAGRPPPGVVVFPVGHPAHWSPSARPAAPELTAPLPVDGTVQPPSSAADHLALSQAAMAHAIAGAVHERAGESWTITDYGAAADALFVADAAPAAVIAFDKDGGSPSVTHFDDSASASSAYTAAVSDPLHRWYIALYDRLSSRQDNGRVDETYLGGVNSTSIVQKTRDIVRTVTSSGWKGVAIAAGGAAIVALIVAMATRNRPTGPSGTVRMRRQ